MRLQQLMLLALLVMPFAVSALAEEMPPTEQTGSGENEEWSRDHMARQEYREEMETIRDEHEQLESEHDALKTQCMNAKGQERSACHQKWQDLKSRKDALHERMKALHEKMANDNHGKWKKHVQVAPAPAAQPETAAQQ